MSLNDNWTSQAQRELETIPVPEDQLNQAVLRGIQSTKKKKIRKVIWPTLVAVAIVILFVTSVRVSPAFASAVSQIPGMERLVAYVQGQDDRGLVSILENEYFQPIGVSQEVNNKILTIEGVIPDETGMVLLYTIDSAEQVRFARESHKLYANDKFIEAGYSFSNPDAEKNGRFEDIASFSYGESIDPNSVHFKLELQLEDANTTSFSIDFELPQKMKAAEIYVLNQDVEIDGNILHFKEAIVSPLKVGVTFEFDENNPDTIFSLEQMELRDASGEIWGTINNGITATFNEEIGEETYFFQSSYFDKPQGLRLYINKVQALPKDEDYLLVNFEDREVLYQPPYADMFVEVTGPNTLDFSYEKSSDTYYHGSLYTAELENGESISFVNESFSTYEGRHHYSTALEDDYISGDVRIEFSAFPHYLDDSAEIQIIP